MRDLSEIEGLALNFIRETNRANTSALQRKFEVGYNRAARIIEALEDLGFISSPDENGKRSICESRDKSEPAVLAEELIDAIDEG